MANTELILLINGFFLAFILLVLLVILASKNGRRLQARGRIREELKKIKEQIEGE